MVGGFVGGHVGSLVGGSVGGHVGGSVGGFVGGHVGGSVGGSVGGVRASQSSGLPGTQLKMLGLKMLFSGHRSTNGTNNTHRTKNSQLSGNGRKPSRTPEQIPLGGGGGTSPSL